MSERKFKSGDVVTLKTAKVQMTVERYGVTHAGANSHDVGVVFFTGSDEAGWEFRREYIPEYCLVACDE